MGEPQMNRSEVTEAIVVARLAKGLKWADIAKEIGQSKEWTTAALLGQMAVTQKHAVLTQMQGFF